MTKDVQLFLKARNMGFWSSNLELYNAAKSKLKRKKITNYKDNTKLTTNSNASLAEQLNHFFGSHKVEREY